MGVLFVRSSQKWSSVVFVHVASRRCCSNCLGVLGSIPGLSNTTCTSLTPLFMWGSKNLLIRNCPYSMTTKWWAVDNDHIPSITTLCGAHGSSEKTGLVVLLYLFSYIFVIELF